MYISENPFVIGRYAGEKYFCDRKKETALLEKQIVNGRDVVLISPRRMGKSGLIHHFFAQPEIASRYQTIFVDIYSTGSLQEFVYQLGKAVYASLRPRRVAMLEAFFQTVKSLRMGFKLDSISGEPSFDIGLGDITVPETTMDEIFQYLDHSEQPAIVAIDEFQQIGQYTEKNTEALLRSYIQNCSNARFIFAGSKRHVMTNMFGSPSKPFYQSAISIGLDPIDKDVYTAFACRLFEEADKRLEPDVVAAIYDRYDGTTWYMQMVLNELFSLTPAGGNCEREMIGEAERNVIDIQHGSYETLLAQLSSRQKAIVQAIAKDWKVTGITSAKFISRHHLGSASSVQAAVKPLLASDVVYRDAETYRIYDYFFAQWMRG